MGSLVGKMLECIRIYIYSMIYRARISYNIFIYIGIYRMVTHYFSLCFVAVCAPSATHPDAFRRIRMPEYPIWMDVFSIQILTASPGILYPNARTLHLNFRTPIRMPLSSIRIPTIFLLKIVSECLILYPNSLYSIRMPLCSIRILPSRKYFFSKTPIKFQFYLYINIYQHMHNYLYPCLI